MMCLYLGITTEQPPIIKTNQSPHLHGQNYSIVQSIISKSDFFVGTFDVNIPLIKFSVVLIEEYCKTIKEKAYLISVKISDVH